jgi:TPR repeat protein
VYLVKYSRQAGKWASVRPWYAALCGAPEVNTHNEDDVIVPESAFCPVAMSWHRKAAAQGQISAMWLLGQAQGSGEGKKMVEAADFLRQAAEAGHTAGWCKLKTLIHP